jgi:MtN3 and saliva related transmembrane protein
MGEAYPWKESDIMDHANLLGLVAGSFTTVAFIPQVVKTWQSKSAGDLSAGMFLIFSTGVFLWLLYGITIGAMPVIIANAVTLFLALAIVALKLRYRSADERQ